MHRAPPPRATTAQVTLRRLSPWNLCWGTGVTRGCTRGVTTGRLPQSPRPERPLGRPGVQGERDPEHRRATGRGPSPRRSETMCPRSPRPGADGPTALDSCTEPPHCPWRGESYKNPARGALRPRGCCGAQSLLKVTLETEGGLAPRGDSTRRRRGRDRGPDRQARRAGPRAPVPTGVGGGVPPTAGRMPAGTATESPAQGRGLPGSGRSARPEGAGKGRREAEAALGSLSRGCRGTRARRREAALGGE